MGVKSPGQCDTQGKKPVKSCASLGVKTLGYCYVDTKKPIPNQEPKGKDSIKEQVLPGLSQGNSVKAVNDIFGSCKVIKPLVNPKVKQVTDSIYRAIQGLGTNEQAIIQAFSTLGSKNEFCGVNQTYFKTYGTNLRTDLDGDIDQETVWANISRVLRNLQVDPKMGAVSQKTGPGAVKPTPATTGTTPQKPMGGVKPTGGAPLTLQQVQQQKAARVDLRRQARQ